MFVIKSLKDIPRIGEKTARRFIEHFQTEQQALDAIIKGDIAAISEIEGMTERSAISLVQEARAVNEGVSIRDFLKTEEAYAIYERIMDLIAGLAHTDYAINKLRLYIPYPQGKKERVLGLQKEIGSIIKLTANLDNDELSVLLSKIKPIKTEYTIPHIRDRVIIAKSHEEFEAAKKFPASVHLVSDPREAVDVARGYALALLSTGLAGIDFPDDIDYEFLDIKKAQMWQVAPEKELAFFSRDLASIRCAVSVLRMIRQYHHDFCEKISDEEIEHLSSGLKGLSGESNMKSEEDREMTRCQAIYDRIPDVIAGAEKRANLEFGSLIEKSAVTVKGFDLLTAMEGGINQLVEKEIREKYTTVTGNAISAISKELALNPEESRYVHQFFPDEVSHPIKVHPRSVEGLKNHLLRSIAVRKLKGQRDMARTLSPLKETASLLVRSVLDFSVGYTIGCFAHKFHLHMPVIQHELGIGIGEGTNLFLKNPVPISYSVGTSSMNEGIDRLEDARVVLLSGVNSGGKTSTIDLLAQTVVLAHMGFPVPAKKCEIGLVDEFYYFGKSKGTLDAGAFESTIRDFSAVANARKKVVLTDEMESITEPGASAKIISGILEELDDKNGLGVFVSHLAESILENTSHKIRVDGIEAKGLDEHLNLIVDRNPRYNYLARSTPELIVERLARRHKENAFYENLLKKFK